MHVPSWASCRTLLSRAAGASSPLRASVAAAARQQHGRAGMATAAANALVYDRHGEPSDVLMLAELQLPPVGDADIQVEVLLAPINPSDVNAVQGKYPLAPKPPCAVPGFEGVARVRQAGGQVTSLAAGDLVVPLATSLGTWRDVGVFAAADWHKVPQDLPLPAAATITINPPTALLMLEDVVILQPGDVVVQNGATSAVGQHVIQLAKAKGIKTVNVIRDRPDWDATVSWLKGMGADIVTTEDKLRADLAASGLPEPALALNCIGGSSAAAIAKVLRVGGTHVTYGAMSLQPLSPPTGLLIFKDITFRGFWVSGGWAKKAGPAARAKLLDRIAGYYQQGVLTPPRLREFPLPAFKEALEFAQSGHRTEKAAFAPAAR